MNKRTQNKEKQMQELGLGFRTGISSRANTETALETFRRLRGPEMQGSQFLRLSFNRSKISSNPNR